MIMLCCPLLLTVVVVITAFKLEVSWVSERESQGCEGGAVCVRESGLWCVRTHSRVSWWCGGCARVSGEESGEGVRCRGGEGAHAVQ